MPIEEKLAEFLESYEAVLKVMHRRFTPLLAEVYALKADGNRVKKLAGFTKKYEKAWQEFSERMKGVPIPPGASAVNFGPEHVGVYKLDYGQFVVKFGYVNLSFDYDTNYSFRAMEGRPLPGSTLQEMIEMIFTQARRVEWKAGNKKSVRTNGNRADYCKSEEGVMEIGSDASRGKFWSPERWEARLRPKIEIGVGEGLERDKNLTYMERHSVITSAMFRKRTVGTGEIDAFLKVTNRLPVLEIPYLLTVR